MFTSGEKMLPYPSRALLMERRWKANVELAPNCPRCNSSNTKFCYYNNYSLTQPRYFCKGCRRYWTKGGSLRNVPVGGGCRKNRRGKSVRISTDVTAARSNFGCDSGRSDLVADGRDGSLCDTASRSDASTIDLAAVYAKFLNQHPDSSDSEVVVPEFVGEIDAFDMLNASYVNQQPPVQFPRQHDVVEHKNIADSISENPSGDGNYGFLSEFCIDQKQEERIDEIPSIEMNNLGLQSLLGEGICQDIDWLNCPVTPNFMWQLPQPQELEPVLEDHLITQSNLLNGNWSSFNMSASDIFFRI